MQMLTALLSLLATDDLVQREATVLVVRHASHEMRHYERGALRGVYEVAFGQARGPKQVRGDNKTPVGVYHVVSKSRGQFEGEYAAYYGGHFVRLNYPGPDDAERGFATIINMRPDNEEPGQPQEADLRRAAEQAGLKYEFLPVVGGAFTEQNIVDFARQIKELPKPILTFCRTGTRCTNLYQLVKAQNEVS